MTPPILAASDGNDEFLTIVLCLAGGAFCGFFALMMGVKRELALFGVVGLAVSVGVAIGVGIVAESLYGGLIGSLYASMLITLVILFISHFAKRDTWVKKIEELERIRDEKMKSRSRINKSKKGQ